MEVLLIRRIGFPYILVGRMLNAECVFSSCLGGTSSAGGTYLARLAYVGKESAGHQLISPPD